MFEPAQLRRVVVLEKMRMGLGDDVMAQLERFLLLVSQENVLQAAPDSAEPILAGDWSPERLKRLGTAIYVMIQGYTDKAIYLTSGLLSWVTHFTLQVRGRARACVGHVPHELACEDASVAQSLCRSASRSS